MSTFREGLPSLICTSAEKVYCIASVRYRIATVLWASQALWFPPVRCKRFWLSS